MNTLLKVLIPLGFLAVMSGCVVAPYGYGHRYYGYGYAPAVVVRPAPVVVVRP